MPKENAQEFDVFNPGMNQEQTPDFSRASRGIDADTSMAKLFKGASDLVGDLISAKDQWYKLSLTEKATQDVDQIRGEFGADAAAAFERDTRAINQSLPAELQKQGDALKDLNAAYKAGTLTASNYWARLDSTARQLRNRYPGYREHIDSEIARLTGGTPANELIASIRREATAGHKKDERIEFLNAASKAGTINPQAAVDEENGNPWTLNRMRVDVAKRTANKYSNEAKSGELSLRHSEGETIHREARDTAIAGLAQEKAQLFKDTMGPLASSYKSMQQEMKRLTENPELITPKDMENLMVLARQWETNDKMVQEDFLTRKNGGGASYQEMLKTEDIQAIRKAGDDNRKRILEDIGSKKFGILDHHNAMSEVTTEYDKNRLLKSDEINGRIAAYRNLYGPEVLNYMLTQNPTLLDAFNKSISRDHLIQMSLKQGDVKTLKQSVEDMRTKGIKQSEVYSSTTQSVVNAIIDPKVPQQAKIGLIEAAYGPGNQGYVSLAPKDERQKYYNILSNPQITDAIWKMKQEGRHDLWDNYRMWTLDTFQALYRTEAQDAQNTRVNRKFLDIEYNPKTFSFNVFPVQDPGPITRNTALSDWNERSLDGQVKESVSKFNAAIQNIIPVFNKEKDGDPNERLAEMFVRMGINLNATKEGPALETLPRLMLQKFLEAAHTLNQGLESGKEAVGLKNKKQPERTRAFSNENE